jgi:hypothetical protein
MVIQKMCEAPVVDYLNVLLKILKNTTNNFGAKIRKRAL